MPLTFGIGARSPVWWPRSEASCGQWCWEGVLATGEGTKATTVTVECCAMLAKTALKTRHVSKTPLETVEGGKSHGFDSS
jgi:hypothetical protein